MKGLKYEKRKMSNSPVRHMVASTSRRPISPHEARVLSQYEAERYQSSSGGHHSPQYSSPSRKKTRREAEHYFSSRSISASPPRRHPGGRISPRPEASPPPVHPRHRHNIPVEREKHYEIRHKHHESPPMVMPSNRLKESSSKVPYSGENSRYRSPSPDNRYPSGGSKSYVQPTLHERFSSVVSSNRSEPRIHYSREDLEKITIDIRRNPRDSPPPPPPPRHMVNPAEVKLVRRANEGHRPIFDREEFKQASRDLREDAYYERKASDVYNSARPVNLREVENYQITRHRFDNHHDVLPSSGRTMNDRFPSHAGRKEAVSLDRDEREKEYQRIPVQRGYVQSRSRSRSGDRDFRSDRYLDVKAPSNSRPEYQRIPVEPPESRNSVPYPHRKTNIPMDARHKLNVKKIDRESHPSSSRSDVKSHYPPENRHYSDSLPPSRGERRDHHHSPVPELHKWDYKSRSPSREKFSEFARRPDNYRYKPFIDKPDISPKVSDFYMDNRDAPSSYVCRGSSRPFRSPRGFRTRGFRGPMRGTSFYRGSFRGYRSSSSPRGRGIPRSMQYD